MQRPSLTAAVPIMPVFLPFFLCKFIAFAAPLGRQSVTPSVLPLGLPT